MNHMTFTMEAFCEIQSTVGSQRAESGGILLGSRDDFIVRRYIHDNLGLRTDESYAPDIDSINASIEYYWENHALAFLGLIHSHPRGHPLLSGNYGVGRGDLGFVQFIMDVMPGLDRVLMPLVFSSYDGQQFQMFPYVVERDNIENYYETSGGIRIVNENQLPPISPPNPTSRQFSHQPEENLLGNPWFRYWMQSNEN